VSDDKLQRLQELAAQLAGLATEEVFAFEPPVRSTGPDSAGEEQPAPAQPEASSETLVQTAQADAEERHHRSSDPLSEPPPPIGPDQMAAAMAGPHRSASELAASPEIPSGPSDPVRTALTIHLRWVLRDIRAKRTNLLPVNPDDLRSLIDLGLVEMDQSIPVLTQEGEQAIR
jgi:hypothetical protein